MKKRTRLIGKRDEDLFERIIFNKQQKGKFFEENLGDAGNSVQLGENLLKIQKLNGGNQKW